MKKLIYFILSICVIVYIGLMIYVAAVPDLNALGAWGKALRYLSMYGGVALLFAFAVKTPQPPDSSWQLAQELPYEQVSPAGKTFLSHPLSRD